MKKISFITRHFLTAFLYSVFIFLLYSGSVSAQVFRLNSVTDLSRVFEDGYNLPAMMDTLKVFGIRGEVISGQCAIQTKKGLTGVTASMGILTDKGSGNLFPEKAVEWNFVGSIPLTENAPNQPASVLVRKAPALFPDYLMQERQISLKEKSCKGIWLTINIPVDVAAGTYTGFITVTSQQGEAKLPVSLKVYPLTLPEERNLKVTEWYSTDFDKFHGIKEEYSEAWFAMLSKYAENMAEHRQNIFEVPINSITIQRSKDGKLAFDFTRFDQIAQVFWDTKKMDFLETGEVTKFGKGDWYSSEIVLKDFKVKNSETGNMETMPGKDVVPALVSQLESHLRDKGWLTRTLFHIKDEPTARNSLAWQEVSAYIHHYAPDLRRFDALETTNLMNEIEIAIPKLDAFGTWYDSYAAARQKGVELWFYTVGIYQGSLFPNKTIDMPVMDSRLMHWLNYRYDAPGYLHWGWNQWTDDPYKAVGMHIGDGWHVYPTKDGVLNSLRWEEMRNGIQDYECFRMLEDKICALKDSLGKRADWIDPKRRGHEISARVVSSVVDHTNDPGVLYDAKKELIDEIMALSASPVVYLQTIPLENATLTTHSSVEVYGWTEPGTEIVINGKALPVSDQGFFLEKYNPEVPENASTGVKQGAINVTAKNKNGTKEITRRFGVK